jgi:hypothetical protein
MLCGTDGRGIVPIPRTDRRRIPGFENGPAVEVSVLYRLGRFLQLLGLLIAPVGLAGNLARPGQVSEGQELAILAGGIGIFAVGWLLQRGARPQ